MITSIEQFNDLANIINLFSNVVPEGTNEKLDLNGITAFLSKNDGKLKIKLESNFNEELKKEFDDTEIKEVIKEYKQAVNELDDNLFLEILEKLRSKVDINKFNNLLDLESYDKDQAEEVQNLIDLFSDITCSKIKDKIKELVDLYNKFELNSLTSI